MTTISFRFDDKVGLRLNTKVVKLPTTEKDGKVPMFVGQFVTDEAKLTENVFESVIVFIEL